MADKKVAFVSGSTSGIGLSIVKKLATDGSIVIISSEQDQPNGEALELVESNQDVYYLKCDIAVESDIREAADFVKSKFEQLDHLVANAGIIPTPCGINEISVDNIDKTIDVNLKGTYNTLRILGGTVRKGGSIVCMTSVDGIIGEPYAVIYSATKAAIISLCKSFARFFQKGEIRVNAVAPGLIDTPLTARSGEDPLDTTEISLIKRMGKPEEIADGVVFLLSDKSSFITGQVLVIDGGFVLK
jgi:3-oxoacyl-[acyl-carrier protein] reductase